MVYVYFIITEQKYRKRILKIQGSFLYIEKSCKSKEQAKKRRYAQMEVRTMLTDMGTILRQAKKEGYGVSAPNAWSLNTVKSIFEAASELKAPVIIDGAGIHQIEEYQMPFIFMKRNFQK